MTATTKGATKNLSKGRIKPANKRYTAEMRWLSNAARTKVRHQKRVAKKVRHMVSRKARGLDSESP